MTFKTIDYFFFTKTEFIQSKVYPDLYLIKNPEQDKNTPQNTIKYFVVKTIKDNEKATYAKKEEHQLRFYKYFKSWNPLVFGDSDTAYFIENEEDLEGMIIEDSSMYPKYKLATFKIISNKKDTTNYNTIFSNIIEKTVTKSQPITDTTNYDNFTASKYLNKKEVTTLKLEEIYPDFYKETHNFKAVPSYKIESSKDFHSLVIVIFKGDNEIESILINYDENRNIVDYRVIAYDEIAESMSKIESRIEQNKVTIDNIFWSEEKQVTTEVFEIDDIGKIKPISTTTTLDVVDNVIAKLGLDRSKIHEDFTSSQILADGENENIVVVIPEIVEEEEDMFELNSHIVLVNTATGKITHKYFEANAWQSDAIAIEEIAIDTTTYQVNENTQAFGIKTFYLNRSQPNPYNNRTISLFVKSGDSLKKILNNYDVSEYGGEWDTRCAGEFTSVDNTFKTTNKKNNDYFDIEVKSKITKTNSYVDEKGECDDEKTITVKTSVLKFDGNTYKLIKE